MPFIWKTPLGYLVAFSMQLHTARLAAMFNSTLMILLIGSCYMWKTFVEDITSNLRPLNVDDKLTWNENHSIKMKNILCNVLEHHSDLKQLSKFLRNILIAFLQTVVVAAP